MVMEVLAGAAAGVRPLVPHGGGVRNLRLNRLYRRVITAQRLSGCSTEAPRSSQNEKEMLQEAVDSLLDNGRRGKR